MVRQGNIGRGEGFQSQLVLESHVGGDEAGSQIRQLGHLGRVVHAGGVTVIVGPTTLGEWPRGPLNVVVQLRGCRHRHQVRSRR